VSTKLIIFIFAIILIAALVAGGLRRGPRVTEIDRTVHRKKDSGDA
jgi:archaellum component FlaG (FlaF/FlaG flagellin family)